VTDLPSAAADPSGRLLASYRTLHEIARMLLGSASQAELLGRITTELKRLVPYDILTVYEIDHPQGMFVPLHVVDSDNRHLDDQPFELGSGFTGQAVQARAPLNLARADLAAGGSLVPGTEWEPESLAIVPLMVRDEPIATLNLSRMGENVAFSDEEFDLICRFADLAALALDNSKHRDRLVKEAQTDGLTGLGNHPAFHQRLRAELERAHRYRRHVSLVMFDLDSFKQLNDVHGHQEGDRVLAAVAAAAAEGLRDSDAAFRMGGEEFALLLPETSKRAAKAAADRLCSRVRGLRAVRRITVSCGVAEFPADGANPTELLEAADAALYAAKDRGKDRSVSYSAAIGAARRRRQRTDRTEERESLAQLKLLGLLARRLNRLNDVERIGQTIVQELRTMIDYHNARVYLLADDGDTLEPHAFGGELSEYDGMTLDALRCGMGEGITGAAAQQGRTLNIGDAQSCAFAEDVEGTADIEESILAVPMRVDGRTTGVIVLSKLGRNQFGMLSVRLLELLAAQAAVAFENARLLAAERWSGEVAQALLEIATRAAADPSVGGVADHVVRSAQRLAGAAGAAVVGAAGHGGRHEVVAAHGDSAVRSIALAAMRAAPPGEGQVTVLRIGELPAVDAAVSMAATHVAVAPLHAGALVVAADRLPPRALDAVEAIARQASLALRSAELLAARSTA
jgi:diguanylate cyclase (GGDEF)-like protein